MSYSNSNYTLANLQTAINAVIDDEVSSDVVARRVRHCLKVYAKFDRRFNPMGAQRHTGALSITSTGLNLDLVGIDTLTEWVTATAYSVGDIIKNGDIGYICVEAHTSGVFATNLTSGIWEKYKPLHNTKEGFHIFVSDASGNFNLYDEILPVQKGGNDSGYYIEQNKIFIYPTPNTSSQVVIQYYQNQVLPSVNKIDLDQLIPIESDAEQIFEEYVLAGFYRYDGLPINERDAEARFGEQLSEFFANTTPQAVFL